VPLPYEQVHSKCKKLTREEYDRVVRSIPIRWLEGIRADRDVEGMVLRLSDGAVGSVSATVEGGAVFDESRVNFDMQISTVISTSLVDPTDLVEVQTARIARLNKPNETETDATKLPHYYFQPWGASPLTWNQVCCAGNTLEEMTVRTFRLQVSPALKPTGKIRWIAELGDNISGWTPPFEYFLKVSIHPKVYETNKKL
jgi:hypothetical protein